MINYTGISESRVAPVIASIAEKKEQSIVLVSSDLRARRLASDLSFFVRDRKILVVPSWDHYFLRYEAKSHDEMIERLSSLKALLTGEKVIVIAPITCAIKKITPHKYFGKNSLKISVGDDLDLQEIRESLVKMGYEFMDMVDGHGQFSFRGGIIDCFTPDSEDPFRIEFFGTEVDSIRSFDIDTQRSIENLKSIEIYPAEQITGGGEIFTAAVEKIRDKYTRHAKKLAKTNEDLASRIEKTRDELIEYVENVSNLQLLENYINYFYDETEYIWDYMEDGNLIVDDPDRIFETLDFVSSEMDEDFKVLLERGQVIPDDHILLSGEEDFKKCFSRSNTYIFTPFPKKIKGIDSYDQVYNINSRQPLSFNGKMPVLEQELKAYIKKDYKVTIVCSSDDRVKNLAEFIDRCDLTGKVAVKRGNLTAGIDYPQTKEVWISDNDIFTSHKSVKRKKYKDKGKAIQSFSELREGDFVVHENHGVGKFIGIQQITTQGESKDYIKIKYAGNDMLYVPVEQMDIVQKYIGGDGATPKINKLSGGEWKQTKQKAKQAIAVMAQDLINLYAERTMKPGFQFQPDTVWQREFEDSFPYQETDDQLRSIEEIKADMEKPFAMDRLLCGDVGFGKTEVAARALFKCVSEGKQAAVLVPTTILANQHYYTLKERFENFPFTVEVLSRFRNQTQQKYTIDRLKKGEVDLVIGTHRLLSKDVIFKDLGLLVVDEEQRFGVEDKETIKKLKTNVDVLTLSATPIPRTLNMSLTGIKDMSLIEEPPEDRYPVQTYVLEQDDQLLKEIIERELARSGQVFVVYNRVRGINQIAERIEKLCPEANVAVGHGQMKEIDLENVMLDFINGKTNVLVSTTIVESGMDIPNANTMIIMDSDRYGLSQLYQLRGRVGRTNRLAYCYLMYQKDKVLTEVAEKRLKAIREFTEFGAGFKVAMRDLELRGAGNMLGTAQSGHITSVGYELYCKMVDEAVRALQGEIVNDNKEETSVEIPVSALIPSYYIENESIKLSMYKKIAGVRSYDDEDDILDELMDRFGDVPKETVNLIKISHIRYLAEEMGVTRVKTEEKSTSPINQFTKVPKNKDDKMKVILDFTKESPLTGFGIFNLNEQYKERVLVHGGTEPYIRVSTTRGKMLEDTIQVLDILFESRKTKEGANNAI